MADFNVEEIISQLSLKDKVQLLSLKDFWHTVDLKEFGIPSIRLSDGPNGTRGTLFSRAVPSACFTCGTGLGSTWNTELIQNAGSIMGDEAKAKSIHYILGPTCNIQRSPLGGRGFESFSEDPFLSGMMSSSIVNGIQSKHVGTVIKHYVANDLEDDRNFINAIVSQRALREVYLYPFQLSVKHANPTAFMTSYNKVNGEHVSQSKFLLTDVLRKEWGWDGLTLSDWFGVYDSKASLLAGLDLECPKLMRKVDTLSHAVVAQEIPMDVIDDRLRNILNAVKYAIESGIPENGPETTDNKTPETSAFLRKLANEAIVLLKNENNFLPLKKTDSIAVIGPNAKDTRINGGGSASLTAYYKTNVYDSVKEKTGANVPFSLGTSIESDLLDFGSIATFETEQGMRFRVYKEPATESNRTLIEEFYDKSSKLMLFDYNHEALKGSKLFYMDVEGDFTPEVSANYTFKYHCTGTGLIYLDDELIIDDKTNQKLGAAAIGATSLGDSKTVFLEKSKTYRIRIEFGSGPTFTVPTNDLVMSSSGGSFSLGYILEESPEERIKSAVEVAKSVDKVILCTGTSPDWESEGFDRKSMDLPCDQDKLITEILKVNKNVVVVNQSGTPVTMAKWVDQVPAVMQVWFNGCEAGNAIADTLFGDSNPSGKLPLTFPKKIQDNPAFLTYQSDFGQCVYGEDIFVGYKYYEKLEVDPLFAFGYGLSYTQFEIKDAKVTVENDFLVASVTVSNTGNVAGAEVVQVYISAPKESKVVRASKELKGFGKLYLQPGETGVVTIKTELKYACSFFQQDVNKWCLEKGTYSALIGNASNKISIVETFEVPKTLHWVGV